MELDNPLLLQFWSECCPYQGITESWRVLIAMPAPASLAEQNTFVSVTVSSAGQVVNISLRPRLWPFRRRVSAVSGISSMRWFSASTRVVLTRMAPRKSRDLEKAKSP
jgi:hypothetical protein